MSFYVFRPQSSSGARELSDALGGSRLRRFENGRFFRSRYAQVPTGIRPMDVIVNWGAPAVRGFASKFLNNAPLHSKFEDATILREAGVNTIEVSRTMPQARQEPAGPDPALEAFRKAQELAEEFMEVGDFNRNDVVRAGITDIQRAFSELQSAISEPVPTRQVANQGSWVGRVNDHVGGADLLTPPPTPDYFVKRVSLTKEYRIHSFLGKSIRAGQKTLREGYSLEGRGGQRASEWIRSFDGGWRIVYDGFESKKAMRELAHAAVKALGLDFGAVDIGAAQDGSLVVLEVNRAPGLENNTVTAYSEAIRQWAVGDEIQRVA